LAVGTTDDATGTGSMTIMPSAQGASFGSFVRLHAPAHANTGDCDVGPDSALGLFNVRRGIGGTKTLVVSGSVVRTGTDNQSSLGSATFRYTKLFAVSATIDTSDERLKSEILPIDETVLDAWETVNFYQYGLTEVDDDKTNFGVVAQDVIAKFLDKGLNALDYGIVQYDEWDDEFEVNEVVQEGVDMEAEGYEPIYETVQIATAGNRYGVAYSQCMILEMACMRRKLASL